MQPDSPTLLCELQISVQTPVAGHGELHFPSESSARFTALWEAGAFRLAGWGDPSASTARAAGRGLRDRGGLSHHQV